MKKLVAAVLSIIMVAALCGCNITVADPEDVVNEFFEAMKSCDEETLILYAENPDMNTLINSTGDEEKLNSIYDNVVKNLDWEIVSVEVNEDETEATVTVKVTNSDFSNVLDKYQEDATEYITDNLYDDDVTKDVMKKKCMSIFTAQVEKAAEKKDSKVTKTVEIKLAKNDSYGWDMEMTKKLMKATTGGLDFPK